MKKFIFALLAITLISLVASNVRFLEDSFAGLSENEACPLIERKANDSSPTCGLNCCRFQCHKKCKRATENSQNENHASTLPVSMDNNKGAVLSGRPDTETDVMCIQTCQKSACEVNCFNSNTDTTKEAGRSDPNDMN